MVSALKAMGKLTRFISHFFSKLKRKPRRRALRMIDFQPYMLALIVVLPFFLVLGLLQLFRTIGLLGIILLIFLFSVAYDVALYYLSSESRAS